MRLMARSRTIIGIGAAILAESPGGDEATGIAIRTAVHAARLEHAGVAVSRVGQDALADRLFGTLPESDLIDVSHIQRDPDLATARMTVRKIGQIERRTLDEYAAFDNLQWDFDLQDIAQNADAVVCGLLGGREGQSRSVVERFLDECGGAVRLLDARDWDDCGLDRGAAISLLTRVDAAIFDVAALRALEPGAFDESDPGSALRAVIRSADLAFAITGEEDVPLQLHTADDVIQVQTPDAMPALSAVAVVHGVLNGWGFDAVLETAARVSEHIVAHPNKDVPADLLAR